jgi:predicted amidohydrolase YtcJ
MPETSLLVSDNLFGQRVGQLAAIELLAGRITAVHLLLPDDLESLVQRYAGCLLDCRGLLVLPGLTDAHVHAVATGMLMLGGDLHEVTQLAELEAAIRAEYKLGRDSVRLGGLDLSRLALQPGARLDRSWLDALVANRPLMIKSVEGHSSWFNSVAWNLLGISAVLESCELPTAEQQRMHEAGRVYGWAYEELVDQIYDSFSAEERREGMRLVLETAAAAGLVGLHCLEGYGLRRREDFQLILELDGQGCDLTLYCRDATPQLALELGVPRFGGCWCVDGAIGAHSAALGEPYADKPQSNGELYFSDEELTQWVRSGLTAGLQVCVHAIGDRALEQIIDIYERLAPTADLAALRPRVDHFILGTPQLAARAASLGLMSAMQPAFDARWGGANDGYAERLGSKRALNANPVGTMLAAGLRVAGSSDCYITPLDPLGGIRAAMRHRNPAHRVDFDTAVRLFSADAAYLAHREQTRGRIAVGQQADFTVVKGDCALSEEASVALTIKSGDIVYQAPAG